MKKKNSYSSEHLKHILNDYSFKLTFFIKELDTVFVKQLMLYKKSSTSISSSVNIKPDTRSPSNSSNQDLLDAITETTQLTQENLTPLLSQKLKASKLILRNVNALRVIVLATNENNKRLIQITIKSTNTKKYL